MYVFTGQLAPRQWVHRIRVCHMGHHEAAIGLGSPRCATHYPAKPQLRSSCSSTVAQPAVDNTICLECLSPEEQCSCKDNLLQLECSIMSSASCQIFELWNVGQITSMHANPYAKIVPIPLSSMDLQDIVQVSF